MFEYAIKAADESSSSRDKVKFHKLLLMLGIGYASQLCTLFAAYLIGDIERNSLSYAMGLRAFNTSIVEQLTTGEPGRIWQRHVMGNVLQLFESTSTPEDREQAGDLFSVSTSAGLNASMRSHSHLHPQSQPQSRLHFSPANSSFNSQVLLTKAELVNVGWIETTLKQGTYSLHPSLSLR